MMGFDSSQDMLNAMVTPPARFKVFAPAGDTVEFDGWVLLKMSTKDPGHQELTLLLANGKLKVINRKVVIFNVTTGEVAYDPRRVPGQGTIPFFTERERTWLKRNPQWPEVLELYDRPVENGEDNDGIDG